MKKLTGLLLAVFILGNLALVSAALKEVPKTVYIIPVKGVIDLGLSAFVKRAVAEAKAQYAQAVILEIDTFGGRVDAAVEICDALEEIKPIPTVAVVDDQAWSAGALISLACDKIIMSPGSSIGSAEPRQMGGGGKDELTDEKAVSAVRAKFKALAEQNNHPVALALAMVDKDFEVKQVKVKGETKILTSGEIDDLKNQYGEKEIQIIKTINPKGKLLNLTAKEAKELGLAEAVLDKRSDVLRYLGLKETNTVETTLSWSELLVRFITHPMVSPLLLTLGFLGLFFELKIPGWGLSGTLGVILLGLFFWGHYLAGLANWTEILIFAVGVILLALEIFVIPGFGLAGILGIALIFAGIFLALIRYPLYLPRIQLARAIYTLGYSLILFVLGVLLTLKFLPSSPLWKKIVLLAQENKAEGFAAAAALDSYLGKTGKALTILRPSGRAVFADKILDVITQGDFIEKDRIVKVTAVMGNKLVVEEIRNA
jgi:membrane-bound serine protease (ClpP class)